MCPKLINRWQITHKLLEHDCFDCFPPVLRKKPTPVWKVGLLLQTFEVLFCPWIWFGSITQSLQRSAISCLFVLSKKIFHLGNGKVLISRKIVHANSLGSKFMFPDFLEIMTYKAKIKGSYFVMYNNFK